MTIEELLARADGHLANIPASEDADTPGHAWLADQAVIAQAFIARADIAVRLRGGVDAAVTSLTERMNNEYWGAVRVLPGGDGVSLLITTDYGDKAEKLWEMCRPWRIAGWQVQMLTSYGGARCTAWSDMPPVHRFEEHVYEKLADGKNDYAKPTGTNVSPFCLSCGYVPPGNNLKENEWKPLPKQE